MGRGKALIHFLLRRPQIAFTRQKYGTDQPFLQSEDDAAARAVSVCVFWTVTTNRVNSITTPSFQGKVRKPLFFVCSNSWHKTSETRVMFFFFFFYRVNCSLQTWRVMDRPSSWPEDLKPRVSVNSKSWTLVQCFTLVCCPAPVAGSPAASGCTGLHACPLLRGKPCVTGAVCCVQPPPVHRGSSVHCGFHLIVTLWRKRRNIWFPWGGQWHLMFWFNLNALLCI